ncbi:S-layer homology domain-containing protein [Paenibacillus taichungensis]|uniref:S-layer homology domain-containing protein n=1 Tax=Paenibacillus taichungensis TaxID=484184 RepID=A0A329QRN7_9BACL|nr:S-layer homology domain-containing protein [Paenibacillus taichungensis]RAW14995.1 S-layer homology domain-containing protein [Paenibacillus taichungensis]
MKKVILTGVAALTLLSAQASIGPQPVKAAINDDIKVVQKFKDITGHWAESSILQAIQRGYVDGFPDGKFLPNNVVTRAEFVKMTVSALDLGVGSASGSWYTSYINAAQTAGIYKAGDFSNSDWTKPMSREEMSKVAVRALGVTDVEDKQWMYLATKNGIITGTAPGEISPEGTTTRAQAIAVIERVLSIKDGKTLASDKYAVAAAELYWHKTNIFTVAEEIFNGPKNSNHRFGIKSWKQSNLIVSAPNGSVQGRVNSLIAIDWNDPKDPNRKLLPSKDKFFWLYGGQEQKFSDNDECYILLLDSELTVNKNPQGYRTNRLALSVLGYDGTPSKVKINQAMPIRSNDPKKEIYGLVIPKKALYYDGSVQVLVETITTPGVTVYQKKLAQSEL